MKTVVHSLQDPCITSCLCPCVLQNVHRGGQGQTLGLANLYELSASASSSATVAPSPSPSFANAFHTQRQYQQRPTTYRPIARREDQVQVVQAIDYRIPKSLQTQEPLEQQLRRLQTASYPTPAARSAAIVQYGDDVTSSDDAAYSRQQYGPEDDQPAEPSAKRGQAASRESETQPNSYARLRFQGDRRVDSFVRY